MWIKQNLFSLFVDIIGDLLSQPRPEGLTEIICPKNGSERVNVALVYPPTPTVVSPSHKWHWLHLQLPACEWPPQTAAPLSPASYVHTRVHAQKYTCLCLQKRVPQFPVASTFHSSSEGDDGPLDTRQVQRFIMEACHGEVVISGHTYRYNILKLHIK